MSAAASNNSSSSLKNSRPSGRLAASIAHEVNNPLEAAMKQISFMALFKRVSHLVRDRGGKLRPDRPPVFQTRRAVVRRSRWLKLSYLRQVMQDSTTTEASQPALASWHFNRRDLHREGHARFGVYQFDLGLAPTSPVSDAEPRDEGREVHRVRANSSQRARARRVRLLQQHVRWTRRHRPRAEQQIRRAD